MDCRGIITIAPGKRGGKRSIRGLGITVFDVQTLSSCATIVQ